MVKKHLYAAGLVFVLGLIPLYDLLSPGVFVGHDTKDHVVRIAHFYQSLQEGIIIPRWSSNLNWGYGHPVMMFLYPLPSYVGALLRFFGLSFEQVTELVFAIGYVMSGLSMYIWARTIGERKNSANEVAGIVAAVLYMYAPYRFVDLYVRGAIGENFFFIWPPLVLFFVSRLSERHTSLSVAGLSFSVAGMLLSHNALSIMFLPVLAAHAVYKSYRSYRTYESYKPAGLMLLSYVLGFGMSSFFLIPAFLEGKYTLRHIVTEGVTLERFETVVRILYSPWSFGGTGQLSVQLGIVSWIVVVAGIVLVVRSIRRGRVRSFIDSEHLVLLSGSIGILGLSLFLMVRESMIVYKLIPLFQTFQFPWRWLSLALFSPAVMGAIVSHTIPRKLQYLYAGSIILVCLLTTYPYWHAKEHTTRPDSYYTDIYEGTTDTGESSPLWSVRFMEKKPEEPTSVIDGQAEIVPISRTSVSRHYTIHGITETSRIRENTLYFPGWNVYIDGVRQSLKDVWWQDPAHRGLITYFVPSGTHAVSIVFERTMVRLMSEIISAVSIAAVVSIMCIRPFQLWSKNHRSVR